MQIGFCTVPAENRSTMDTTELENAGIPSLTFQQLKEMTDDFSDDRKLGEDTFATFYLGVQKDGERVAVKVFRNRASIDESCFLNEFNTLIRLDHQNIEKLVAYCCQTETVHAKYEGKVVVAELNRRALCITYAQNGSLQYHLSDEHTGFDWRTRYRIIKGICEGLKYLHHGLPPAHFLHLDINPGNILLDENMEPKLAGFDMGRFLYDDEYEICDSPKGTGGYIPKEYIDGGLVSMKFDISSLGVVMLEIVAGSGGYYRYMDNPSQAFIDLVHANWRRGLLSEFRGSTLDAYCEQVKRCTEIAVGRLIDIRGLI